VDLSRAPRAIYYTRTENMSTHEDLKKDEHERYYHHHMNEDALDDKAKEELIANIDKCVSHDLKLLRDQGEAKTKAYSVYVGYAGIAFAFLIAGHLDDAEKFISGAEKGVASREGSRITLLEGVPGVYCVRYLIERARKRDGEESKQKLIDYLRNLDAKDSFECNEMLYGVAGAMMALYVVDDKSPVLQQYARRLLANGTVHDDKHEPLDCLNYRWHGALYLGFAHGVLGIVNALELVG
jgi:hypothetical protein